MPVSSAALLTEQFYEWETRGRGWHRADFACELEPPFEPFFGHWLPERPIIDDGRRPTFFQRLLATERPAAAEPPREEGLRAYPRADDDLSAIFSVAIPKGAHARGEQMEQLLVMLSYCQAPMSFELIASEDSLSFQLLCRESDTEYVRHQLRGLLNDYAVRDTCDDELLYALQNAPCTYTIDFGLEQECVRPLAQLQGDREPLVSLYSLLNHLRNEDCVMLQVLFSGLRNPWAEHMRNAVYDNDRKSCFFFDDPDMLRCVSEKTTRPLVAATVRLVTCSDTMERAQQLLHHAITDITHATQSGTNRLLPLTDSDYTVEERLIDVAMRESHRTGMLLNSRELCTLAHFPLVPLPKTHQQRTTKAVPPFLIGHGYVLGSNEHNNLCTDISLSTEHRLRHMHVMGVTGAGKSTLLHSLMMEDVLLGNGFMCLDPHGDLIDMLLDTIPEERVDDVVLIDPTDSGFPIGLNMLFAHSEQEKDLLASDLVALFRRFSTSWGDQMNSVFANAILAFLYNDKTGTIADLRRFLIETPFRASVLATCTDPAVAYYWKHEYPLLKGSSIGSILTRLDSFLRPRTIRNMVCQQESLDFAALMDTQKIILVKLSQGLLGTENSYLLGAFIVSKLQQIAMARQAQAKDGRVPFFCYVDEFHHFVTPSMGEILGGTRKYGLGLVLAHQTMQQVQRHGDDIESMLSNAGTRVCFRLADTDARRMQEGFSSFTAGDLQNLAIGEAVMRVYTADNDCSMSVIPYTERSESKGDIVSHSRAAYSNGVPTFTIPEQPQSPKRAPRPEAEEAAGPPAPSRQQPACEAAAQAQEREHRHLQTFVKGLAERAGYKAQKEVPTPDGAGLVDVLASRGGAHIAIEISVSTSAEWELHNVRKCLLAGYGQVVVCATSEAKLRRIRERVDAELPHERRVQVMAPDHIHALFIPLQEEQDTTAKMKGYRVRIEHGGTTAQNSELIRRMFGKE